MDNEVVMPQSELADLRGQLADLEAAVEAAVQDARNGWAAHDSMLHLVYKNDARADHWRRRARAILRQARRQRRWRRSWERDCDDWRSRHELAERALSEMRGQLAEHRDALQCMLDMHVLGLYRWLERWPITVPEDVLVDTLGAWQLLTSVVNTMLAASQPAQEVTRE